ncbi:MAG: CRISPR-associated helicase Cas3' [Alphaproteobacteria bacterium]|nr:CRISPR-associated helicase Cas3' [Alphaproteobacteria bacterium]
MKNADKFSSGDWGYLAGLWHDLGKYNAEFQDYIRTVSAIDTEDSENAHLEVHEDKNKRRGPDHSTAGALHALRRFKQVSMSDIPGRILAYIIAGHHAGLADWDPDETGNRALSNRLQKDIHIQKTMEAKPDETILNAPLPRSHAPRNASHSLWIRMLFSCLVDADFLDTENFLTPVNSKKRNQYPNLNAIKTTFDNYMGLMSEKLKQKNLADTQVNSSRATILKMCRQKSVLPPGHFSLTVPTGGGKTLASLGFALEHAHYHKKERIIYVIPYTSITEQTAQVFRDVCEPLGDIIVEHHSNFNDEYEQEKQNSKSRLATENWDAPIIVTTTVQFFESLFAARTSRVRKLHNICNSIVILDEVQLLPAEFLNPICDIMNQLKDIYSVTFVLSTATQPVLENLNLPDYERKFKGLTNVREIIDNPDFFYKTLQRVSIQLPNVNKRYEWPELAEELQQYKQVLCIVSKREDCRNLHHLMPEGTIHLSALMCAEHRREVINNIKIRISNNESIKVISTQLVEAGVDFDFPVVYRSMAGLDSIAQAAGRCNREGKLGYAGGKVVIFHAPQDPPKGILKKAAQAAEHALRIYDNAPLSPNAFHTFFEYFYSQVPSLDKANIITRMENNPSLTFPFRTIAQEFSLIDDGFNLPVVVRYGKSTHRIEQLLNGMKAERWLWRELQRFSVNIPRSVHAELIKNNEIKEVMGGLFVQIRPELYDPVLGFCEKKQMEYAANNLIG